jgi:hypothetical protein
MIVCGRANSWDIVAFRSTGPSWRLALSKPPYSFVRNPFQFKLGNWSIQAGRQGVKTGQCRRAVVRAVKTSGMKEAANRGGLTFTSRAAARGPAPAASGWAALVCPPAG